MRWTSSASAITEQMKRPAARAIAWVVADEARSEEYDVPTVFNRRVVEVVSVAVAETPVMHGVARRTHAAPAPYPVVSLA